MDKGTKGTKPVKYYDVDSVTNKFEQELQADGSYKLAKEDRYGNIPIDDRKIKVTLVGRDYDADHLANLATRTTAQLLGMHQSTVDANVKIETTPLSFYKGARGKKNPEIIDTSAQDFEWKAVVHKNGSHWYHHEEKLDGKLTGRWLTFVNYRIPWVRVAREPGTYSE